MGLLSAFDNRSLRVKIGSAVLAATVSGLIVGTAAVLTVHGQNSDAAKTQRQTIQVENAVNQYSKNIETFSGNMSAIQLYPAIAKQIKAGMDLNQKAITAALATLTSALNGDAQGTAAVAKAGQDWQAFLAFISGTSSSSSVVKTDITAGLAEYNKLHNALVADQQALQDLASSESEAAIANAAHSTRSATWILVIVLGVGVLLSIGLGLRVANRVRGDVRRVSKLAEGLADGDLTRTSGVDTRDEVGRMAVALDKAIDRLREDVVQLAGNATTLHSAAEQLTAVSGSVDASAQEASAQAGSVASAADVVSNNLQVVSAGSEEMGSSIRDISVSTSEASEVAAKGVQVAAATEQIVARLGESSSEIGDVLKVITSIAEQTNLLALNATIEAARAGDSGKGFAVVAGEVKDLAQETAKATEDIGQRVAAIQTDTGGAVTAIGEISAIIERINGLQLTIASAVEEQTATTAEMNRTLSDAANGAQNIAATIGTVSDATRRTTDTVGDTRQAADELAVTAGQLQSLVSRFRY